jgi:hypothetical protein
MPPALITLYNSLNFPESIAIRHRDPSHSIEWISSMTSIRTSNCRASTRAR